MIDTMIGAYCQVCNKMTIQLLRQPLELRDDGTYKATNDNYQLICEECKSIECSVETFLELSKD